MILKQAAVANLKLLSEFCLQRLTKATKILKTVGFLATILMRHVLNTSPGRDPIPTDLVFFGGTVCETSCFHHGENLDCCDPGQVIV